jgi:predicted ATPase/class 3 adenylate cyclase
MPDPPAPTSSFLFTDIEGSTRLWEDQPQAMEAALARHDDLSAALIGEHGGVLVKSRGEGDSLFAVFTRPEDAVAAALALQRALHAEPWPEAAPLRVRVAVHTGEATQREGDYYGAAVNRCARLRAAAHGGQILLSGATREAVHASLPEGVSLLDLGTHRLRDLARPERIYQVQHPALPRDFPLLRSLDARANNLPEQPTSFIGRAKEIEEVRAFLRNTRLLTLSGAGGCGKSRLGLEVAAQVLDGYEDGAWQVELASISDPSLVAHTVASVLGVRGEAGAPIQRTLTDYLRPRQLLLLLDNCEHLLAACAGLADAILRGCPKVRILASSREGLNIPGEMTYRVPSLSVPDPRDLPDHHALEGYEAVRLFVERAGLSQPGFGVHGENASVVAQVCHRLDGIPLAIELAAARLRSLSIEEINARLDDRFRLLTGGSRTALPRQQTLRALIDWSYDLLSDPERVLLRRLSVFRGGWTVSAAEAVASGAPLAEEDVLDLLTHLVDRSLVSTSERAGTTRYRLLETVRQYAGDRLLESGEVSEVRGRHARHFVEVAEEDRERRFSAEQNAALARLEEEHDNLRAAIDWSTGDPDSGTISLRLVGALAGFWNLGVCAAEGRERLAAALAQKHAAGRTAARATALHGAGLLADNQGDFGAARALYEESLSISRELGDTGRAAMTLNNLATVASHQGRQTESLVLYEEGLRLFREVGDQKRVAWLLVNLGRCLLEEGELNQARSYMEESLRLHRESGHTQGIAFSLNGMAHLERVERNFESARAASEEALRLFGEIGDKLGVAGCYEVLAEVASDRGDAAQAVRLHRSTLEIFRDVGSRGGMAGQLRALASLESNARRAARLYGAAEALREATGAPLDTSEQERLDHRLELLREELGEAAFGAAWAEGNAMTSDEAVRCTLVTDGLS